MNCQLVGVCSLNFAVYIYIYIYIYIFLFSPKCKLKEKDVPFLCCTLGYVGNICEHFKNR